MAQRLTIVLPVAIVLLVAGLGYTMGPIAALVAVVGAMATVLLVAISNGALSFGAPAPRTVARVDAPAPVETGHFTAGLGWALGLAILARAVAIATLNGTTLWAYFAPDGLYWQYAGAALLARWQDPTASLAPWLAEDSRWPLYAVVNGLIVGVFGTARIPASIINASVSLWVAFNVGRLANRIYGRAAARRAYLMTLFFPSMILWSSMNIREAWSMLVISYALLFAYRLRQRLSLPDAMLLLGTFIAMFYIRPYLVPLLVTGIGLSYLVVRPRQIPYAIVVLFLIVGFGATVGPSFGLDPQLLSSDSLQTVDELRRNLAFGGSAYGSQADTTTIGGSLAYLPEGVTRFIMAPFPWAVRSWRQMLTVPEAFVWYATVVVAVRNMASSLRHEPARVAPIFFVLLIVTCAYGLVSGNEGTAYRHRAQVMILFFVFAAARPFFNARRPR